MRPSQTGLKIQSYDLVLPAQAHTRRRERSEMKKAPAAVTVLGPRVWGDLTKVTVATLPRLRDKEMTRGERASLTRCRLAPGRPINQRPKPYIPRPRLKAPFANRHAERDHG
jgi:hypothetical protein